uniref:DMT family transporter n=1 Tax=Parerythrobacter lutipelagi TaxID=1964208 RepID=UPI0010FA18F5|nr:EamA family transporter [Parerythrobacter lutipelagi]
MSSAQSGQTGTASLLEPRNFGSFLLVSLIWGGTWLVIRDQLSSVPAQWSITYRFAVAALGMFALVAIRREPLTVPRSGWGWVALLGLLQFVLNFTFVYNAELFITSGLVAVMFALLMVPNAIFGKLLLGQPIRREFVIGTGIAALGIALLFAHEYRASPATLEDVLLGVVLTCGGILAASGANIVQAMDGAKKLPFLTLLAWAMAFGVVVNCAMAWISSGPPVFDPRPEYAAGVVYLGLLGSVCTFPLYYRLVREVGAGTAAYSSVLVPVVAMVLSTLFEGFAWGPLSVAGAVLAMAGLLVAMRGRSAPPRRATPEP